MVAAHCSFAVAALSGSSGRLVGPACVIARRHPFLSACFSYRCKKKPSYVLCPAQTNMLGDVKETVVVQSFGVIQLRPVFAEPVIDDTRLLFKTKR